MLASRVPYPCAKHAVCEACYSLCTPIRHNLNPSIPWRPNLSARRAAYRVTELHGRMPTVSIRNVARVSSTRATGLEITSWGSQLLAGLACAQVNAVRGMNLVVLVALGEGYAGVSPLRFPSPDSFPFPTRRASRALSLLLPLLLSRFSVQRSSRPCSASAHYNSPTLQSGRTRSVRSTL